MLWIEKSYIVKIVKIFENSIIKPLDAGVVIFFFFFFVSAHDPANGNPEQQRWQNSTLFYLAISREPIRGAEVSSNIEFWVDVEGFYNFYEFWLYAAML